MSGATKITQAALAAEPWGPAFNREFDLVIAANLLRSLQGGEVLCNSDLDLRVAEFCAPLDRGLTDHCLGVIAVPANAAAPHQRVPDATAVLAGKPRGTWAVFDMDGKYDGYMADGYGGLATETGLKFSFDRPDAPRLSFLRLYAAVLGTPIYHRRNQIKNDIVAASVAAGAVAPGHVVTDVKLNGRTYGKIEFLGRDDRGFSIKGTRRGVKPERLNLTTDGFMRIFAIPFVMPDHFQDPRNADRLEALTERRSRAAQAAWDEYCAVEAPDGISPRGTKAEWRIAGDHYRRDVYRSGEERNAASGVFSVTFAAGTAQPVDRALTWEQEPDCLAAPGL